MALRTRPTQFAELGSGVATEQLTAASRLVSYLTGFAVQPNKAIVGGNAFAHESGIHQDGVIKNPLTYEIMTPQSVGLTGSQLTIGKLSGRRGLQGKLQRARLRVRGRGARRDLPPGGRARRRQEGGHRRRPPRPRRAAHVGGAGLGRARRLERDLVARRQRDRLGHAHDRRRGADRRGDRQRPGQRPVRRGGRGAPARPRLASDADRVRDQGGVGRRGRPGPGAGPLPPLVGRGARRAGRDRPRVIHQHHRGVARGVPRRRSTSSTAPRSTACRWRSCRRARASRSRDDVPRSRRSRATGSGRRSSPPPGASWMPPAPGSGSRSSGRSSSSAARRSTRTASRSATRTSRRAGRPTRSCSARSAGPKWSDPSAPVRPEQALFALRGGLGLFANLRPDHGPADPRRLVAAAARAARRRRHGHRPRADRRDLLRGADRSRRASPAAAPRSTRCPMRSTRSSASSGSGSSWRGAGAGS